MNNCSISFENGFGTRGDFDDFHFTHDQTCGFHWPSAVRVYQIGPHWLALVFSGHE